MICILIYSMPVGIGNSATTAEVKQAFKYIMVSFRNSEDEGVGNKSLTPIQEEEGRWAGQPEGRDWVHGARVREGEGTSGVVKTCSKVFLTEGTIGAVVLVVVKMWKSLLIRG